jgi:glutamate synthase (NADPH) large chain
MGEAVGRVECLRQRVIGDVRPDSMDLSPLLVPPADPGAARCFVRRVAIQRPRSELGDRLEADAYRAVWDGEDIELAYPIVNADRTVGAALSGALALEFGSTPPPGSAVVRFTGSAGQSFGAFLARGVTLDLVGDTNDYCGKGLSGGRISVQPSPKFRGEPTENIITGNVVLYGAIAGEAYFRGVAGERFAVRNSGARAVVEGVGDHGCEYMTGGTVVVLGATGRNFAAGMSGGLAYVLDVDGEFAKRCNSAMVDLDPVSDSEDETALRRLIENHQKYTGSKRAAEILGAWAQFRAKFVKVFPKEYRRALAELGHKKVAA